MDPAIRRKLNEESLYVITAVQRFKALKVTESHLGLLPNSDWHQETEKYYHAMPSDLMKKAGLKKNVEDLENTLIFLITDEMKNTEMNQLCCPSN